MGPVEKKMQDLAVEEQLLRDEEQLIGLNEYLEKPTEDRIMSPLRRRKQQQAAAQQQAAEQQKAAAQQQAAAQEQAAAQQAAAAAAPAPAAPGVMTDDKMVQLQKLGELKAAGILTEEEFSAEKAKILAS